MKTMDRPPHIQQALATLLGVALTHPSVMTCAELIEVNRYVAQLERRLAAAQRPTMVERLKAWWRR